MIKQRKRDHFQNQTANQVTVTWFQNELIFRDKKN